MDQFKTIAEQKAMIDRAQEPLLKELNDVKKQIDAFDDRRQEAQVGVYSLYLFCQYNLLLAFRPKLHKLLNSDLLHRMSNFIGLKSSARSKRRFKAQRNSWTSSKQSLR